MVEIEGGMGVGSTPSKPHCRFGASTCPRLSPSPVYIPRWPPDPPRNVSCSRRYARRPGKLTLAQESTIRALAKTKGLRSLAWQFGVSHETVRSVLKR